MFMESGDITHDDGWHRRSFFRIMNDGCLCWYECMDCGKKFCFSHKEECKDGCTGTCETFLRINHSC